MADRSFWLVNSENKSTAEKKLKNYFWEKNKSQEKIWEKNKLVSEKLLKIHGGQLVTNTECVLSSHFFSSAPW